MPGPLKSRIIDSWAWFDAPPEFKRFLQSSLTMFFDEDELVPQGRHEWFLCVSPKPIKLGGDNRVQTFDVLRGHCLFDSEGEAMEASKKPRTALCICRAVVHDSGAFQFHDISPMEGYDVGFCPVLPAVVRHCLNVAYSRYSEGMTYEREAAKPNSFEQPPPFLHNLAPVDLAKINKDPVAEAASVASVVDLTGSEIGDEGPVIGDVINQMNKAIMATSIKCSTQIPRVVANAACAAIMACESGTPVATITEMNPCMRCGNEILVAGPDGRMESLDDSTDSSSGGESADVGAK